MKRKTFKDFILSEIKALDDGIVFSYDSVICSEIYLKNNISDFPEDGLNIDFLKYVATKGDCTIHGSGIICSRYANGAYLFELNRDFIRIIKDKDWELKIIKNVDLLHINTKKIDI